MTAAEDTKHRLFSFVNELNAELEAMDGQITLLQQELNTTSQAAAKKKEARGGEQKVSLSQMQLSHVDGGMRLKKRSSGSMASIKHDIPTSSELLY